jgi:hypothetical protein
MNAAGACFTESDTAFSSLADAVHSQVESQVRLPEWPFTTARGYVTIYEYDRILGGDFGEVLDALASTYRDNMVTVVGFEPNVSYYRDAYGLFPGFQVSRDSIRDGYGSGLMHEPRGNPTGSLGLSLDVMAIAGDSGSWAAWGQRDWEIGLLLTPDSAGVWLDTGLPWFAPDFDLDSIRSPAGWGVPLGEDDYAVLRENISERMPGR